MTALVLRVVAALIAVESGGNPAAIGDGGRAVGVLQMWPIAVREAVRLEAIEARREGRAARVWTDADRMDPAAAREMCAVTLRWHYRRGVVDPVALGGRWRNPGGGAPGWYLRRVERALRGVP
jgi:hypothetical protein